VTIHRLHGLRISSVLPLSGDRPAERAGGIASAEARIDIDLRLEPASAVGPEPPPGDLLVSFSVEDVPIYSAAAEGDTARLRIHGLCEFEVESEGRVAWCRPAPDAPLGQLALVGRGAFLAFWLGLRGECVLHASAVEHGGKALAFVGGSGMGKSTLAGWACSVGARFVSDDLLRLDGSEVPRWVGCSPELRLRPSAETLVAGHRDQWQVQPSADGRLAGLPPLAGEADEAGSPIRAVVVPRPSREAGELVVERLDPVDAVLGLARFPRLEGWRHPRAIEAQLDGAARLARAAAVHVATIPWGPPFPATTIEELMRQVDDAAMAQPSGLAP